MTAKPFAVRVTVRLNPGVNDPQGNTVRDGLANLGHRDVRDVRVGKVIDLVLDATSAAEARTRAAQLCDDLLANPVIETYDIDVADAATSDDDTAQETI